MPWNHIQFDDEAGRVAKEVPSIVREAKAADPNAPKAPRTLPDDTDCIILIDKAARLTIADMPNALRLLENS